MPSEIERANVLRMDNRAERVKDLVGNIIGVPYLTTINGLVFWVADVDVGHGDEIIRQVPIAQYAQNLRHSDNDIPVRLQKNSAGQLQIVGRADLQRSNSFDTAYNPKDQGLLFAFGMGLNSVGQAISANTVERQLSTAPVDAPASIPVPPAAEPQTEPGKETVGTITLPSQSRKEVGYRHRSLTLGELEPLGSKALGQFISERIV